MIPQEKSEAVTRALHEVFGATTFEDARMMTKGLSGALVYRIVVGGTPFLLRLVTRVKDPTLPDHFTCMKEAAEAGLAPRVRYTSVEDKISITDFVENVPFPQEAALNQLPATLRALHSLPPFPGRVDHLNTSCTFLLKPGPALDAFLERLQASSILPQPESQQLFAWHAQLAAAYPPRDFDLVSSHNDLFRPDNILFDRHRVWLVDWEAAFVNDRYVDLAVVADFVVAKEADEVIYLQHYFGQRPDEFQLARFTVMRAIVHMFYAMAFLLLGSAGEPVTLAESVPDFRDFHRKLWTGEISIGEKQTKLVYGKVHWRQLCHDMQQPSMQQALSILSSRHALA